MEGLKKSFLVRGNNIVGFDGSGEENTIESISVNGVDIAPDENKNVDITVPSIDGLTKDADLATVAKSGNYEDLNNKPEIPSIEGLAKTTDIPTKVSQLENDSKYQTESDVTTTLTDYATKTYVGEQITNAEHLKREIVTVLPSNEEASDNIIYMLKVESATGDDKYQEYMKIDGAVQMVGDTSVDLTDYAKIAEIPTTVAELTDSADYAKSADIPTSLPANGGNADTVNNHTVNSDVPESAVFTDTVYDDTEVKESIDELNESLSVIGKCKNLLNPTLQTTTMNGVTCTDNGDGTYTLNGTASSQTTFVFAQLKASNLFKNGITYKLCGCPKLNNSIWFMIETYVHPYILYATDYGDGETFTYTSNDDIINIFVRINGGIVLDNVVLKPMITTDLSATYDDFVPYTGDGDTLTHDVAELKNDLYRIEGIGTTEQIVGTFLGKNLYRNTVVLNFSTSFAVVSGNNDTCINSSTGMESQASSCEGNIHWNSIDTLVNAESFAETSSYEYTNPFILTKDKTGYWYCHNVYGTTISATKIVLTLYYTKYN